MNISYIFTMAKIYQKNNLSFSSLCENENFDENLAAEVWIDVAHSIDSNDPMGNLKSLDNKMTKVEMIKQCEQIAALPVIHEWEE